MDNFNDELLQSSTPTLTLTPFPEEKEPLAAESTALQEK